MLQLEATIHHTLGRALRRFITRRVNCVHTAHTLSNQALQAVQSSFYTAKPRFEQQSTLFERSVSHCKWKDESGPVCEEVLTYGSLPEHLSMHGIKNMTRDSSTKCNWVGCKRKRPMNRESIVRHIREVHLGLKRPLSSRRKFKALV